MINGSVTLTETKYKQMITQFMEISCKATLRRIYTYL